MKSIILVGQAIWNFNLALLAYYGKNFIKLPDHAFRAFGQRPWRSQWPLLSHKRGIFSSSSSSPSFSFSVPQLPGGEEGENSAKFYQILLNTADFWQILPISAKSSPVPSPPPMASGGRPPSCTLPQSWSQNTPVGHGCRWPSDAFVTTVMKKVVSIGHF